MYTKRLKFQDNIIDNGEKLRCKAMVDIKITKSDKGEKLSICGDIRVKDSKNKTLEHSSGQCVSTLRELFKNNKKAQRVADVWDRYANNELQAGTPKQMAILRTAKKEGKAIDYDNALEILKVAGLDTDNGYIYGSKWLFEEIPQEILDEIKQKW